MKLVVRWHLDPRPFETDNIVNPAVVWPMHSCCTPSFMCPAEGEILLFPETVVLLFNHFKARVYNPGERASELARFESGTSSKYPPPFCQCSVQSHTPTNLNAHLAVGLSREKEMPEHDAAIQLNLARSRQEVKR